MYCTDHEYMTGIEEMDNIVSDIKTISLRRAKRLAFF